MRYLVIIPFFLLNISYASDLHDVLIRGGTLYDGSGGKPFAGDIAISGDLITVIGDLSADQGLIEIDASGLVVAPGFINMLSLASRTMPVDPRALAHA